MSLLGWQEAAASDSAELDTRGLLCNMACRSNAQDLLVIVDNYGRVKVTDYPCLDGERGAAYLTYGGHAKDVKNVKMACDDSRFFTVGGTAEPSCSEDSAMALCKKG